MTLTSDVSVIFADARQVHAEALERMAGGLTSQRRVSHQTTSAKLVLVETGSRGLSCAITGRLDSCLRRNGVALQPT